MKLTAASLVSFSLSLVAPACAVQRAPVRHAYERYDPGAFPARVRVIRYTKQNLDGSTPMQLGAWKISFRSDGAIAEQPHGTAGVLHVKGLECTNETRGTKDCMLELRGAAGAKIADDKYGPPACFVLTRDDLEPTRMQILTEIGCPLDVELENRMDVATPGAPKPGGK